MESISFINKKNHKFSETEQEKLIKYKLLSKDNPRFFELFNLIIAVSLLKNFNVFDRCFREDEIQDFFSKFINANAFEFTKKPNLDLKVLLFNENNKTFYSRLYDRYKSHLLKELDGHNIRNIEKGFTREAINGSSSVFFVSEITNALYENKLIKYGYKNELTRRLNKFLALSPYTPFIDARPVFYTLCAIPIIFIITYLAYVMRKEFSSNMEVPLFEKFLLVSILFLMDKVSPFIKSLYISNSVFSKIVNEKKFFNKENSSLQDLYINHFGSKIYINVSKQLNNTKETTRKLEEIIEPKPKANNKNKITITKISEIKQSFLEVFSVPTIREIISILRDLEKQLLKLTVEDAVSFKIFVLSKQKDLNKKLLKLKVGVKEKSKVNKIIQKFIPDDALLENHFRGFVDKYRYLSLINNFLFVMKAINRANNLIQKIINRKKNILLQIFFERYKLNIDSLGKDNTNSSLENNASGFGVIYTSNVLDVANLEHKILKDSLDRIYAFILTYGYSENDGANISDIKVLNRLLLMFVPKTLYSKESKTLIAPYFCKDLDLVLIETISKHAFWAEDNEYYNGFLSASLSEYSDRSMEESSCVFIERLLKTIPENDKDTIRQKKKVNSSYSDHTGTFDTNNWKYKYADYKKAEIFIKLYSRLRESIENYYLDFNVYLNMYLLSKFCVDSRIMLENPGVDFTTMMDAGHNRCSEDLHGNNIKNNIIKHSKKVLKDKAHQYINTESLVDSWCVLFDKIAGNLKLKKVTDIEFDKSLLMQMQF